MHVMSNFRRWIVIGLVAAAATGCASVRTVRNAEIAVQRGDYDSAVAYYREALAHSPERIELRIALERTTRIAASEHVRRARELEAQDQLTGAMAEYRLASDLDPSSTLAASKAAQLARQIRDLSESSRPQARIETLRQQAAQTSPIPRLDPRAPLREVRLSNIAVRDLLKAIADLTGINVTYDTAAGFDSLLSRPYSIDIRQMSLEEVLNQVMQANGMTFKIVNPQTIFVYQDNPQNRTKFEDQYAQTFYLSNSDATEVQAVLNTMLAVQGQTPPRIQVVKTTNSIIIRGTVPVLKLAESIIRSNDRPRPEVLVEAEILEVDRQFIRQLGIDLNQYSLGFTFSPELAPPNTSPAVDSFPSTPPPFNLNTISRGVSAADFYLTSPTALVRLLESNTTTKILAKTQLRGRDSEQMTLKLGDSVPIPQTTFNSAAAGGVANIPTTSVNYQSVGVNLLFTPRVTYQDEIILNQLTLEKSGLGNFLTVAGQSFPTIVTRQATGSLRLRDGESNLVAGLLRDDDRKTLRSFPGITKIPFLRALFGNSDRQVDQTDIVMIITPHIVRSHELTPEDLQPQFVGTGGNIGSGMPALLSPEALGLAPVADAGLTPSASAPGAVSTLGANTPAAPPAPAPRALGIVPIEAISPDAAPSASGAARVVITAPNAPPDGALAAGGGPYTLPITISNAPALTSLAITVTYDPTVLKTPTVTQGSFMSQGGVTPTFVPRVDAALGRIDIVFSRPTGQAGAAGQGLVGALAFVGGSAGATDLVVTGVATSATGQTVPLDFAPLRVTVR